VVLAFCDKDICSILGGILLIRHLNRISGKISRKMFACEKTVVVELEATYKDYFTFKIVLMVCLKEHFKLCDAIFQVGK
jgi:hypothetical protein